MLAASDATCAWNDLRLAAAFALDLPETARAVILFRMHSVRFLCCYEMHHAAITLFALAANFHGCLSSYASFRREMALSMRY